MILDLQKGDLIVWKHSDYFKQQLNKPLDCVLVLSILNCGRVNGLGLSRTSMGITKRNYYSASVSKYIIVFRKNKQIYPKK